MPEHWIWEYCLEQLSPEGAARVGGSAVLSSGVDCDGDACNRPPAAASVVLRAAGAAASRPGRLMAGA